MSAVHALASEADDLPAAFADVVDTLHDATIARFEQMEDRLLGRAKGAALAAVLWSVGIVALITGWACANVALGLWLTSLHGGIVAILVAGAIHALVAIGLMGFALATSRRQTA